MGLPSDDGAGGAVPANLLYR